MVSLYSVLLGLAEWAGSFGDAVDTRTCVREVLGSRPPRDGIFFRPEATQNGNIQFAPYLALYVGFPRKEASLRPMFSRPGL